MICQQTHSIAWSLTLLNRVNWEWKADQIQGSAAEGEWDKVGGAECACTMNSVIATVCVSLVLLETASSVDLGAVV